MEFHIWNLTPCIAAIHFNLADYVSRFSYFGIYLWFAVLEQLTPIPEEVSLTSVGYIAVRAHLDYIFCGISSLAGLVTTDSFLYYVGKKGKGKALKLLDKVNPELLDSLKEQLKQNKVKAIIIMGLLPKLRFLSPVICATGGIPFRLFFWLNLLVTASYTAFYMLLGVVFHSQLSRIMHKLETWQTVIFIVVMAVITVFIFLKLRKSVMRGKEEK